MIDGVFVVLSFQLSFARVLIFYQDMQAPGPCKLHSTSTAGLPTAAENGVPFRCISFTGYVRGAMSSKDASVHPPKGDALFLFVARRRSQSDNSIEIEPSLGIINSRFSMYIIHRYMSKYGEHIVEQD